MRIKHRSRETLWPDNHHKTAQDTNLTYALARKTTSTLSTTPQSLVGITQSGAEVKDEARIRGSSLTLD